jgi:NarL family two-component system response regulator LiaR
MGEIKIAIVEDDVDWLKMMIAFLNEEKEFMIVGTATDKNEAVQLAKAVDIDFIIMDINLSGNKTDGIQAASEIGGFSKAKIIMLSILDESEIIIDSFTFGAVSFVPKNKFQNIPVFIKELAAQKTPFEILLQDYQRLKRKEHLAVLTATELETFTLLEQGLTQREIALKLIKSEDTVKIQVTSILKKLNVHSVVDAIKKANLKRYGWKS